MKLIDADALIDRLDYCVKEGMGSTIAFTFKHMVEEAPTIDIPHTDDWEKYSERLWKRAYERGKADRPQGKWIYQFRDSENEEYRCSKCGFPQENKMSNFCPNCGARMKGADDEQDNGR